MTQSDFKFFVMLPHWKKKNLSVAGELGKWAFSWFHSMFLMGPTVLWSLLRSLTSLKALFSIKQT